jgi:hypothetical protein
MKLSGQTKKNTLCWKFVFATVSSRGIGGRERHVDQQNKDAVGVGRVARARDDRDKVVACKGSDTQPAKNSPKLELEHKTQRVFVKVFYCARVKAGGRRLTPWTL